MVFILTPVAAVLWQKPVQGMCYRYHCRTLAIGMEEEEAARMGVYVHGLAGEKAAAAGSHSLLATELSRQ